MIIKELGAKPLAEIESGSYPSDLLIETLVPVNVTLTQGPPSFKITTVASSLPSVTLHVVGGDLLVPYSPIDGEVRSRSPVAAACLPAAGLLAACLLSAGVSAVSLRGRGPLMSPRWGRLRQQARGAVMRQLGGARHLRARSEWGS